MSWDCTLTDAKTGEAINLEQPHYLCGGTYAMFGTTECWLSVTYNYSPFFRRFYPEDGLRSIDGKTGKEAIPILLKIASGLEYSDKSLTAEEIRERMSDDCKDKTDEEVIALWEEKQADVKGTYWEATEGNALQAVLNLITMSTWAPDGVWKID